MSATVHPERLSQISSALERISEELRSWATDLGDAELKDGALATFRHRMLDLRSDLTNCTHELGQFFGP